MRNQIYSNKEFDGVLCKTVCVVRTLSHGLEEQVWLRMGWQLS